MIARFKFYFNILITFSKTNISNLGFQLIFLGLPFRYDLPFDSIRRDQNNAPNNSNEPPPHLQKNNVLSLLFPSLLSSYTIFNNWPWTEHTVFVRLIPSMNVQPTFHSVLLLILYSVEPFTPIFFASPVVPHLKS